MPGSGFSSRPGFPNGNATPGSGTVTGNGSAPFPVAPPQGSAGAGAGPLVRFMPSYFPVPSAQEFNEFGSKATAAVESMVELTAAKLVLQSGMRARIASVVFYVMNLLATSNITFTLQINGVSVPGYNVVPIFPGAASRVSSGGDSFINVPDGSTVQAFYSNGDGGTYTVGVQYTGWLWTAAAGDRWVEQGI